MCKWGRWWQGLSLLCLALGLGCESNDEQAEGRDAGTAPPVSPSDAGDASSPFVDCEVETIPQLGENVSLQCDRCGPNGSCTELDPTRGDCRCSPEYVGERCELCAEGYVEHEGACVTPCQAAGVPCAGVCSGTLDAPVCECAVGYQGAECAVCSPGFESDPRVFDAVACVPTCEGACSDEELCRVDSHAEQRCECMVGYERDTADDCVWQGFTADPSFEHGCAHWRLLRQVGNPTDQVIVELEPSELRLSVDHKCSAAAARAEAFLPTAQSMPGAAIAITASGNPGARLLVSIDERPGPFLTSGGGEELAGSGDFERYLVCLPLWDRGQAVMLTLAVGEGGSCSEALDASFVVRSIEVTSDAECER
jgi:hypothetical protein